jgi:4-hydroxy 2-oxovalerate aldolase
MQLLDCTIRDGGYVNNWEFTNEEVEECYKSVSEAGFSYFEIGFRTNKSNKGKGKWFYCDEKDIFNIKNSIQNGCKIAIMTRIEDNNLDLDSFLPCDKSPIDMVRVFLTYESDKNSSFSCMSISKLQKCRDVLIHLKKLNYTISLNLGSTRVLLDEDFHNIFKIIINNVDFDYLYFADSYGSLLFNEFDKHINKMYNFLNLYNKTHIKLGFHAHNNLGNAYTNFIKCLNSPIKIIDSTVSGLGRGSGNLHSEICILHLYKNIDITYNVKPLLDYSNKYIYPVKKFYGKYKFGYNNILMICGMYNIHPNYGLELLKNYDIKPSECFEFLLKLNKINIKKNNFNYDKNLISSLINKNSSINIKAIIMDFDGTLSNGKVYINTNGDEIKTSNTKDGYIIKKLRDKYIFVIISGSDLTFFKKRASYLGIKYIFDKVSLKKSKLETIMNLCNTLKLKTSNIAFIGDDLNDLDIIQNTFSACPIDAIKEIKNNVSYICKKKGGEGCVREFIDHIEIRQSFI